MGAGQYYRPTYPPDDRRRSGARRDQNGEVLNYRADGGYAQPGQPHVGPARPWQPADNAGAGFGSGITPQTQWEAMFPTSGADRRTTVPADVTPADAASESGAGRFRGIAGTSAPTEITPTTNWEDASRPMAERMEAFNNRRGLAGQQTLGPDQVAARARMGVDTNLGRPAVSTIVPQTEFNPTAEDARAIASRYATPGGAQPAPIMASAAGAPTPKTFAPAMGDRQMAEQTLAPRPQITPITTLNPAPNPAAAAAPIGTSKVAPQRPFAPSKFAPLGSTAPSMQSKQVSQVFQPAIVPRTSLLANAAPVLKTPPGFPNPRVTAITGRGYRSPLKRSNNAVA